MILFFLFLHYMGFYIKKQYIKQADMVFLGFEAPADSIFFVLLRSIRYSMLFTWHWHAKRTGELEEVGQFDEKFQKPFKIFLILFIIASIFMIIASVMVNLYHPEN